MKYTTDNVHFLQSEAWAKFQTKIGRKVISDQGDGWSYQAVIERASGFRRLYCPYGPVIDRETALSPALESLQKQAQFHKIDFLRLQPIGEGVAENDLSAHGLKAVPYSQPADTWCVNLEDSLDEIYSEMKQNTRNICRNYQKKGLNYKLSREPNDIEHLIKLLKGVADHNKISVHSPEYFRAQAEVLMPVNAAELHIMEYQNQIVAAALAYQTKTTCYYAHAAASFEHRKLGASTALVGEIIRTAKENGLKTLDLYGVTTSDDSMHPWAGFTRFKQSFGGSLVHLGYTYELAVRPLPYFFYRQLRAIRKKIK